MLRRLLAIILCLLPLAAEAQPVEEPWFWFFMPGRGNIVRAYHLDRNGLLSPFSATMGITFDRAVAATYAAEIGGQTFTIHGTPDRVTDGTWPAGFSAAQGYGWTFDGSTDYLTSTIGPPAGAFSAILVITPTNLTGLHYWYGNFAAGTPIRGWVIYTSGTSVAMYLSDDGSGAAGHAGSVSAGAVMALDRPAFIVVTYDPTLGDGAAIGKIYADENTVASSTTMDGPIFAGAAPISIGAGGDGGTKAAGIVHDARYFNGVILTPAEITYLRRQWWGAFSSDAIHTINSTESGTPFPAIMTAPVASGTEPFLVDLPADTARLGSPVAGSGGLVTFRERVNFARNPSAEVCTAAGATEPDYYTVTETAGDGSAAIACSTTTRAHRQTSIGITLTGTTSSGMLVQGCRTDVAGGSLHQEIWARKASGTTTLSVGVITYTDAACTLGAANAYLATATGVDVPTAWTQYEGEIDLSAAGSWQYKILSEANGAASVVYLDGLLAIDAGDGDVPVTSWCLSCITDAACTCDELRAKFYWPACTEYTYEGIIRTPYGALDLDNASQNHYYILNLGSGLTANATSVQIDPNVIEAMRCTVHSSAADMRWNYGPAWTADTDHAVACGHRQSGNGGLGTVLYREDGTNYANEGATLPGSAVMNTCGDTYGWFGGQGTSGRDAYIREVIFRRAPVGW